ncbi:MAG: hypothetical protein HY897_19240 [Deltaproteobacteria bacterium]|nr:hypothetical protein [Deltaproteobacteria bacterium]
MNLGRLGQLTLVAAVAAVPCAAWAGNDAAFVSQNVPQTVVTGRPFAATVTMRNTGDTSWSLGSSHFLGSENPQDNTTWGTNRMWMDPAASVPPGGEYAFTAVLTAPGAEGAYDFQWRMLQDAVEWFGETSANVRINAAKPAFICDGTEVVCLDLTLQAAVEGSGGEIVGGDFAASGFQPSQQGGIDWAFGPERDFSAGEFEVDVTGLQPLPGDEGSGGKVSIFAMCGVAPQDNEGVGIQKMAEDYRDGHIFRYGMDDDGLADNWDAVIITGRDFGCYYSINDPPWQAGDTHHFRAKWSSDGLELWIDGTHCASRGNGDTFDPANKVFTLANRCTHYPNQHAIARFSNLRLWARGSGQPTDAGMADAGMLDAGLPDAGRDGGQSDAGDPDAGPSDTGSDTSDPSDSSDQTDRGPVTGDVGEETRDGEPEDRGTPADGTGDGGAGDARVSDAKPAADGMPAGEPELSGCYCSLLRL